MKQKYKEFSDELSKRGSSIKISWVSRKSNKIAHKYAYSMLKSTEIFGKQTDGIIISKDIFDNAQKQLRTIR